MKTTLGTMYVLQRQHKMSSQVCLQKAVETDENGSMK
uniref:Uncharacterized protein n=1 Tax=Tetranychus urticae TaxID=32264 RepID=T1KUZ6_TETUR